MRSSYLPTCCKCDSAASWTDNGWRYYCPKHRHDFCEPLTSHTISMRNAAMTILNERKEDG